MRGAGGLPSQSPNGDSSPKGGAKYVRYQKLAQSQVSPPPLGEVSCQRHDGEGEVLVAPSHGLCRSAGRLPSQSRLSPCQRLGCRLGRPLGNVPPGRSGPRGGAK